MNKQSKTKENKTADRPKRGGAIKKAVFNLRMIRGLIENLLEIAPSMIGEECSRNRWGHHENIPYAEWEQKIIDLFSEFEDQVFTVTVDYEDAVFFPQRDQETNQ